MELLRPEQDPYWNECKTLVTAEHSIVSSLAHVTSIREEQGLYSLNSVRYATIFVEDFLHRRRLVLGENSKWGVYNSKEKTLSTFQRIDLTINVPLLLYLGLSNPHFTQDKFSLLSETEKTREMRNLNFYLIQTSAFIDFLHSIH